ncbi:uncharacterized protein LOC116684014 isoform X1 [Etheostoma spectabile]|uniref:uncharacterized protein LOC116684014 isoform X1 n=2 Tax=Etheostoma spectabile TaxID=54343 RepID=UPI0013AEF2A7|nr:uncharacterized protein LOC116684014 isoform X1 [Etheostoma spectabile]
MTLTRQRFFFFFFFLLLKWTCLLCKSSSRTMCCRCPSGAGRTLQAVPQTGTFILAARGSGHAAGPRGAISVSHRKSEGGEPHEAAAAAFHRGDLDLRESRSGEDGGRGGSKPQAQTGPRTELDVLYKLSHRRRRRRSRRRGKRRRRRTRGTGGGGGGGGGGGERRKRGSFRQTQRTKSGRLRRCRPGASPILCPAPDADFTPVASDNTKALLREVGNHRDFGQFLHADFHWTAPCTSLANPHCVRYTFDVDGVMIQLRHTRGMVAEIYLNLSRVVATLQPRRRGGT